MTAASRQPNGDWDYTGEDAYADPDFDQRHAAIGGGVLELEGHNLQVWPVAQEIAAHDPDVVVSMWGTRTRASTRAALHDSTTRGLADYAGLEPAVELDHPAVVDSLTVIGAPP